MRGFEPHSIHLHRIESMKNKKTIEGRKDKVMKLFKEVEGQEAKELQKRQQSSLGRLIYLDKFTVVDKFDMERVYNEKRYGMEHSDSFKRILPEVSGDDKLFTRGYYDNLFPYDRKYQDNFVYITIKVIMDYDVSTNSTAKNLELLSTIDYQLSLFKKTKEFFAIYENGLEVGFVFEKQFEESILEKILYACSAFSKNFELLITEYEKNSKYKIFQYEKFSLDMIENKEYPYRECSDLISHTRRLGGFLHVNVSKVTNTHRLKEHIDSKLSNWGNDSCKIYCVNKNISGPETETEKERLIQELIDTKAAHNIKVIISNDNM